MFRYYVFGVDELYPAGGLNDVVLKTNDLKMAQSYMRVRGYEHDSCYIYDWLTDEVIQEKGD